MTILHLNNYFCQMGGTERYLFQILDDLQEAGHNVCVMYEYADESMKVRKQEGRNIDTICASHLNDYTNDKETLKNISNTISKIKPDLIHIHNVKNPHIIELCSFLVSTIRFVHDHTLYCPKGNKLFTNDIICNYPFGIECIKANYTHTRCFNGRNPIMVSHCLYKKIKEISANKKLKKLLVASEFMKNQLIQNGFSENKIVVIPHCTDIPNLSIRNPQSAIRNPQSILFVGRLSPSKGVEYLIKSLPLIKTKRNYKLLIVGNGDKIYIDKLKELSKSLNIESKISFVGNVSFNDVQKFYNECSFLVFPSIWAEPFGYVGIEAMANCKPVIAFDVGGVKEWLKDGKTGFLVEPKNLEKLADKISLLLENDELRISIGNEGRKEVYNRFNRKDYIGKLLDVYCD